MRAFWHGRMSAWRHAGDRGGQPAGSFFTCLHVSPTHCQKPGASLFTLWCLNCLLPHRCPSHRSLAEHLLAVCRDERAVHHSADLWAGLCSSLASRGSKSLQQTGFEMHPKAGLPDISGGAGTLVLGILCKRPLIFAMDRLAVLHIPGLMILCWQLSY